MLHLKAPAEAILASFGRQDAPTTHHKGKTMIQTLKMAPKTRPGTLQAPGPLQASILVPLDINLDFRRRFDRLLGAY